MRKIIARAWKDTARSYGITWGAAIRVVIAPAATLYLGYTVLGETRAMSDAWTFVLNGAAFLLVGFLPLFLWNLWLAPYKILNERLDKIPDAQAPPTAVDEEAKRAHAERVHLYLKKTDALKELRAIRLCIDSRSRRDHTSINLAIDHQFMALREKYSSWLLPNMDEIDMRDWVERIIAILEIHDYDVAEKRILRAVLNKSWEMGD